jgi:hypothetical protein
VRGAAILLGLGLVALGGCGGSSADNASQRPSQLVRLSPGGPEFLAYDGDPTRETTGRDWPVSLIFADNASVGKVKRALRTAGLTRKGLPTYLGYRQSGARVRFDVDHGLKTRCDRNGSDVHVRLYAPPGANRFIDPRYGSFVVGTAHIDRADGCSVPPKLFGFSEVAERRIGRMLARRGWRVQPDRLPLPNAEPYRRDVSDPAHVWWGDGRATLISVP